MVGYRRRFCGHRSREQVIVAGTSHVLRGRRSEIGSPVVLALLPRLNGCQPGRREV